MWYSSSRRRRQHHRRRSLGVLVPHHDNADGIGGREQAVLAARDLLSQNPSSSPVEICCLFFRSAQMRNPPIFLVFPLDGATAHAPASKALHLGCSKLTCMWPEVHLHMPRCSKPASGLLSGLCGSAGSRGLLFSFPLNM